MKQEKRDLFIGVCALIAFVIWTLLLCTVDVRPIGPLGSSVGMATLNGFVKNLIGAHMVLYTVTDWLGLVPLAFMFGFAILGLWQWIKRKNFLKVDYNIFVLGGFYLTVIAVYFFFEEFVVNYRPILICGVLEASYPSSTTMLVMCVIPTAIMQLRSRIQSKGLSACVVLIMTIFLLFMIIGRLLSGVHWFSDIVGGALLSIGLVMLYRFACGLQRVS